MTQQEVIKTFNESLNQTEFSGRAALDEAIQASSDFANFEELKRQFLADIQEAKNWHTFLVEKCGIILDNADTGAISGSDAGGTEKTATTILPATGKAKYPSGSSFTVDGLTIYGIPEKSRLTEAQQYVVQGLYSWWIHDSLSLIKESYGYSYTDVDTTNSRLKLKFIEDEDGEDATTLAYVSFNAEDGKKYESRNLCVNMARFKDMDTKDRHGTREYGSALDRTLVHELVHGLMASNVNYFNDLPGFLAEGGTAELVHGLDDEGYGEIIEYAKDPDVFSKILRAVPNGDSEDHEIYTGGYIFMRYFAKQAATDTTFDYDTYRKTISIGSKGGFATNYWDNVTMKGGKGSDTITNSGENVSITASSGKDTIKNYSDSVTVDAGADNDEVFNEGSEVSIIGGKGADSIENEGDNVTILGGAGNDTVENVGNEVSISGDANDDYISNEGDKVSIDGGDGDDLISNEGDEVLISGGAGNNSIDNSGDSVTINGGDGSNTIENSGDSVIINGGAGDDEIENEGSNALINGGAGEDGIDNCGEKVTINSGAGYDYIENAGSNVLINCGEGDDIVYNEGDYFTLLGGAGVDYVYNYGDDGSINGGAGEDSLYSCGEGDSVNGGSDNDYVLNEGLKSYILGDKGNDTIYNEGDHVTIEGGAGNDSIVNDGGKHIVCKFGKSDGKDTFVGFNDYDTVQITSGTYSASKSGNNVVIKVSSSTLTLKDAADKVLYVVTSSGNTDTISFNTSVHDDNITSDSSIQTITNDDASKQTLTAEISTANASTRTKAIRITGNGLDNSILGGTGKDTLYGKDGNDYISGGKGNDKLYGQNGNDTLWGGVGNDTLTGGKGVDTFIYNPNEGTDTIADYQSGELVQIMGGTFTNAVFDSNRLTLNVDGGGSLIFKNVATSTEFNINNTTYHVSGNTIK